MKIRPLQGQALVLLLPHDEKDGSIVIPEIVNDAVPTHENMYVKKRHRKGIVQEIGPWKKTKTGLAILPDFKRGDTVVLNPYVGKQLTQGVDDHLRLVSVDDVIGVLTATD